MFLQDPGFSFLEPGLSSTVCSLSPASAGEPALPTGTRCRGSPSFGQGQTPVWVGALWDSAKLNGNSSKTRRDALCPMLGGTGQG